MEASSADIERFVGRYSLGRDGTPLNTMGSLHFLRVKVPGGLITCTNFRQIAELAAKYSKQQAEITDRQDIQLHWIGAEDALDIFSAMAELGFTTDMCGQSFAGARYGDVRNIVSCPVSGIERDEILNSYPLVKALSNFFIGNPEFLDLPRKFKISVSGCGSDCTRARIDDLAFVAVKKGDEVGYTLLVGGSAGVSLPGPRLAKSTGVFVMPEDVFDVAVAAVEIFRDHGNRESKAKARFKWLIEEWGVMKFLKMLQEKVGRSFVRYDGPIFVRQGEHEGVQWQAREGYYYVNVPLTGGRLTSRDMILISELAEKYGSSELRLTPTQSIIIPNVKEKDALLRRLEMKFTFNGPKLRWNSLACSSDFCGKTCSPHAKELLKEIVEYLEKRFDSKVLDEADLRIYVNGCLNNCCASMFAEIGLNSKQVRDGNEIEQTYDLFLGGGFGLEATFGRLIEEKVLSSQLKHKIESLLNSYLKNRLSSESLRSFCNRHTLEELKAYLNTSGG